MQTFWPLICALAGIVTFFLGWVVNNRVGQGKVASAEKLAEKIVSEAEKEAEALKNKKVLEAKDEWFKQKQNFERETRNQRQDLDRKKNKLQDRELELDRRFSTSGR